MRILYSLLVALSVPFVLLYFAVRGLRDRAYLQRWGERFGFIPPLDARGGILLHAASVGEYNAAKPLILALLRIYPDLPLLVTTLTPTGSERVLKDLGDRIIHTYIPLDFPFAVSRFLSRARPRLIVMMETEVWPNLYLQAHRRDIPLAIANARLSATSVKRYQRLPGLARDVLRPVSWVGAQSTEDAERMIRCGTLPQHTTVTGNLKFDLQVPANLSDLGAAIRTRWNPARPVLVAGSTHEADESVILPAFTSLLLDLPDALLILVPRHPERFGRAAQAARVAGLNVALHSEPDSISAETQCLVVDAMGELLAYYASGDLAFIGGSFGAEGGHNPLEPAALGKPLVFGPNMENTRKVATQLLACGAARQVHDRLSFSQAVKKLLRDAELRNHMGQAGQALVNENQGALDLTLRAIEARLTSE